MNAAGETVPVYHDAFASLANVILEDSWILSVDASLTELTFRVDLVLAPLHPSYRQPATGQTRCYRTGTLVVVSESAVILRLSSLPPAVDAAGEVDYGHIDTFAPVGGLDNAVWALTGDWGEVLVRKPRVRVQFDEPAET
ncbi:hypothetical protein [Jidongwangia harbinensis]|uniref:hypothetical protein n=1 Tax=Jidongwangia harbinensis TaxID=2878561 RepID=UPI001CD9664E|nr:hypothetical protein [Jidongwangia harbinensis]MCA2219118.1 hypothetical protein [Jidongwangia harbinensis]